MVTPLNLDAQLTLRSLFCCHFVFTALVLMGDWPGVAYFFYNTFLLGLLIWAELTPTVDSELPILKCLMVEAASIFFDIIIMAARYGAPNSGGIQTFALVMAILHLLGRLPSCFVLFRLRDERRSLQYGSAGGAGTVHGGATGAGGLFGGVLGGGGGGAGAGPASTMGPGGYEEFPPSYGAGVGGPGGYAHDTKPLPP